ncbi:Fluoride export protein 1 [Golovinomyces cichoracearum]|uniref:Fluoride export protein 1 n=1 Tax=Golovinomyces cichoracearum TaxID=62708 RepID=A0A420GGE2_9PEZI|nr:Fluoride export protein 1 [Golovinomyces cichoracearum]
MSQGIGLADDRHAQVGETVTNDAAAYANTLYDEENQRISGVPTQILIITNLILFAILGTLTRVGIQSLTSYTEAPITFSSLWYNFTGSFIMGFLVEDCKIFNYGKCTVIYRQEIQELRQSEHVDQIGSHERMTETTKAAKKTNLSKKKLCPLYIGLTTGFCGCLTSFSSFVQDIFLALADELPTRRYQPQDHTSTLLSSITSTHRNFGFSLMAVMAVILVTMSLCFSAWLLGTYAAQIIESYLPDCATKCDRNLIDGFFIFLACSSWIIIIVLVIYSHVLDTESTVNMYGPLLFSLVLAPLGCFIRYYVSLYLNSRIISFPLGTFAVNVAGTVILGISYDLQHVTLWGILGCQILQGLQSGFCGCLTTVSSLIAELNSLPRKHAYIYGAVSILVSLCLLIIIMGSLLWLKGFTMPLCVI